MEMSERLDEMMGYKTLNIKTVTLCWFTEELRIQSDVTHPQVWPRDTDAILKPKMDTF